MNEREKKLIFLLVGAALLIGTIFLYTSYDAAMKKNKAAITRNNQELGRMKAELAESDSQFDDAEWLAENPPIGSSHGKVGADLVNFVEKSALKSGVAIKKRPSPVRENPEESGAYRSAVIKVTGNATDPQIYRWLVDLQSPNDHRSITLLRIEPQRDDDTKVNCELEVTQWFTPPTDEVVIADAE